MNFLKDLWLGKIAPNENHFEKNSIESNLAKEVINYERKLIDMPDENECKIYESLSSVLTEHQCNSEYEAFIKGFQLGARIILDVFYDIN